VQTVCSAVHNVQCVIPMLQIDSGCTILILFFLLTYNGSATSRKVGGSIPDGVTVIFSDPVCRSFRSLVRGFLHYNKVDNYREIIQILLQNCQKLRCPMSLSAHLRT